MVRKRAIAVGALPEPPPEPEPVWRAPESGPTPFVGPPSFVPLTGTMGPRLWVNGVPYEMVPTVVAPTITVTSQTTYTSPVYNTVSAANASDNLSRGLSGSTGEWSQRWPWGL